MTIEELVDRHLSHIERYYVTKNGKQSSHVCVTTSAMSALLDLCRETSAEDFGPRELKAVRQSLIESRASVSTR